MIIKGYNFFKNKNIFSSLIKIFGIGNFRSKFICDNLNINIFKKNKYLSSLEIKNISDMISKFKTGDSLKREIKNNINKLIYIKCYKGMKHFKILNKKKNIKNNFKNEKNFKKSINNKFLNVKKKKRK